MNFSKRVTLIIATFVVGVVVVIIVGVIWSNKKVEAPTDGEDAITNFDECESAGYPVMESYPRRCNANGETFVEEVNDANLCDDKCGDGICQEVVCLGVGCPCAETTSSCPIDCQPGAGIANPASVYCEEHGGTVETQKDTSGNEYGVCKFSDGSECEEWAFYRGDCRNVDNI